MGSSPTAGTNIRQRLPDDTDRQIWLLGHVVPSEPKNDPSLDCQRILSPSIFLEDGLPAVICEAVEFDRDPLLDVREVDPPTSDAVLAGRLRDPTCPEDLEESPFEFALRDSLFAVVE